MAEEIVIGKLILDSRDLEISMAATKKAIIDLENEQKKLKKDTENLSGANDQQLQSFVYNELQLKKIKAEYSANQKSVLELTKAQTGLDAALTQQNKTQAQATANTKELTVARRLIDETTTDGKKVISDINAKIDANNKLVVENGSAQEKAANISGNYRQVLFQLDGALSQFGINGEQARNVVKGFGEGIVSSAKGVTDFTSKAVESTRATLGFKTASQLSAQTQVASATASTAMAGGQAAVTTSTNVATLSMKNFTIALAATGIGLVVLAVGALVSYLSKLDPVLDKIEQLTSGVGAAFSELGRAISSFDFSNLIGGMSDAANAAIELTKANQELADLQSSQEVSNAKASQQYDELILKSKNRTLTEKQRIAFINQAQKIEEDNFKQRTSLSNSELANAIKAAQIKGNLSNQEIDNLKRNTIAYANYLLNSGKITQKEYDAIKSAELGKVAIRSESTKRLEKSQNAEDKLADDSKAKNEKRQSDAKTSSDKLNAQNLKNAQNAIDILKSESNARNLDAAERLSLAQNIFDAENALAEKSSTGSDLQKQLLTNRQNLSSAVLAIADEQINKEIEAQKLSVEQTKAINAELYDSQSQSANDLARAQILLLDKKLLSEKAYADEVKKINIAKNESLTTIQFNFDEAEKVRLETAATNQKSLDDVSFQIKLQDITDRDATEQEIKRALLQANYENDLILLQAQLDKEKEVYGISKKQIAFLDEKYSKDKSLIDKKYKSETKKDDKILAAQKQATNIQMLNDSIGALQAVFGESKALSVASALVNTYQGITAGVKLGYPAAIPAVAFAAATGFAAVKNILKTNKGSTGGGDSGGGGGSRTTSGTGSFVNNAQTETVARATDRPTEQNIVVTPPVLILETLQEKQNNLAVKITSG